MLGKMEMSISKACLCRQKRRIAASNGSPDEGYYGGGPLCHERKGCQGGIVSSLGCKSKLRDSFRYLGRHQALVTLAEVVSWMQAGREVECGAKMPRSGRGPPGKAIRGLGGSRSGRVMMSMATAMLLTFKFIASGHTLYPAENHEIHGSSTVGETEIIAG